MRALGNITVTSLLVSVSTIAVAIGVMATVSRFDDGSSALNIRQQDHMIVCLYLSLPLCGVLYGYLRFQRVRTMIIYGALVGVSVTIGLTMLVTMSSAAIFPTINTSAIGGLLLVATGLIVRRMRTR